MGKGIVLTPNADARRQTPDSFGTLATMETEPSRRRVRRAKKSRPVAPGHSEPVAEAEAWAEPSAVGMTGAAAVADDVEAAEPVVPADFPEEVAEFLPEMLPDSSRDGAWLPAGITVLVMVSLLVCAGLVLIASRQ